MGWTYVRGTLAGVCLVALVCAATTPAGSESPTASSPSARAARADAFFVPAGSSDDELHVELRDRSAVALTAGRFSADTRPGTRLNALLARRGPVVGISKLYRPTGRRQVDDTLGAALADYYVVRFGRNIDMRRMVTDLERSGLVAAAYPAPRPAPPPTSPSFAGLQTYLDAAPVGTDSTYASTFPGGTGDMVKLVDIEYSWNVQHEDLPNALHALVPRGTPVDPYSDDNHGTAVLGEIDAANNGFGVTGAAYGVSLALVNADSVEYGYDLVGALATAATITRPGDVIQIELAAFGPHDNAFVPVEWTPEVYDAIVSLTGSGRIVVEPASNSNENLDDTTYYGTRFPMGEPDSGAIIVGAGENCAVANPPRTRLSFSDYGARVDLQGPGDCVVTTGYGTLSYIDGPDAYYSDDFAGTSAATPVVAAAAASISSAHKALNQGAVLSPDQVRALLEQNATPQSVTPGALTGNIGPYPDLHEALEHLDVAPPTVAMLAPRSPVRLTAAVAVSWSAVDPNGVRHTDVRRRVTPWNATHGAWVAWLSPTADSASYTARYGETDCFEIRAENNLGDLSNWSSPRCTALPLRASQLSYSQHWRRVNVAGAFGGLDYATKYHGAQMSRTGIIATSIDLVVTRCRGCGTVTASWNGRRQTTVNLDSPTTRRQQLIRIASFPSAEAGTLTVRVTSPNGRPVHIEGLAIDNP